MEGSPIVPSAMEFVPLASIGSIAICCVVLGLVPALLIIFLISKLGLRAGAYINYEIVSSRSTNELQRRVVASISGMKNTTLSTIGDDSIVVTRRFIPSWAIVVAVISAFLFWPGMLVLFAKDNESLNVQLVKNTHGSTILVSGVASKEISDKISLAIQGE